MATLSMVFRTHLTWKCDTVVIVRLSMKTCRTSRPIPDFSTGLRVAPSAAVIRRFMPIIKHAAVTVLPVGISCQLVIILAVNLN